MTNEQKQSIDADEKEGELSQDKPTSTKANLLWIALIVVLLISVGLSGWLYLQQGQQRVEAQAELSQLQAEKQGLLDSIKQNQTELTALQNSQQTFNDAVNELKAQQQFSTDELLGQWQLREVEFLLNIANQRALLAHDVAGAIQALQMADSKIQQLADYRLHPLRAQIAEELMTLQALADVDLAGMGIQLQTAINHVDNLRVVKGPQKMLPEEIEEQESADTMSRWQQAASDIWQQIRSLVVIRHNEKGDAAVLVPEQRYFLYQNMKLQLESARLSLLKADNEGYKHSLATAIDWLNQYFVGDERDAMLASLTTMRDKPITITVPDISGSLNWLQEYQQ